MFIRFVVSASHPPFGNRTGIFQAAYELRDSNVISERDLNNLKALLAWFSSHLTEPIRFGASRKPNAKETAISWFKPSAREHIARARELIAILKKYDIAVEMIKTSRPGYIVFEDEHQIVALPFSDSAT